MPGNDKIKQRWVYFNLNKIAPSIFNSSYVTALLDDVLEDFSSKRYPSSISELSVDGNDLMVLGLQGKQIGDMLTKIIGAIYSDNLKNNRNDILNYINKNKNMLTEETKEKLDKKVVFYDFDGTLIDSPMPNPGKEIYKEKTGKDYPHRGWWGRPESMDLDIFDIKPHSEVEKVFRKDVKDPHTIVVLLTNRLSQLAPDIKKVLVKNDMKFDHYSFKYNQQDKGDRVLSIMKKEYPDIKNVVFYDDDEKHIQSVQDTLIDTDYSYKVHHVVDGKIK